MRLYRVTHAALVGVGIALLLSARLANQDWWDRHFLPIFALRRETLVIAEQTVRVVMALAGAALALVLARPIAGMLSRATLAGMLRILLALLLALGASEVALRARPPHPHDADSLLLEPRRQPDPRLGWVFVPARSVLALEAGRRVSYSFDASGHRVPSPGATVDADRPSLLFTGESIVAGFGLGWQNTIPARVSALLGMQSVNMAVSDYSNDQSYLRLAAELPRFRQPVAVVTLFMPSLFDRNLLGNRPHLDTGLVWRPAVQPWRLVQLFHWLIPYRSSAAIERSVQGTRETLCALVDLARSRGAEALIVVPQFEPESATDEMLRRRILDEPNLPYVQVKLDPSWHLPDDRHPDERGAKAIAAAVARAIPPHLLLPPRRCPAL